MAVPDFKNDQMSRDQSGYRLCQIIKGIVRKSPNIICMDSFSLCTERVEEIPPLPNDDGELRDTLVLENRAFAWVPREI